MEKLIRKLEDVQSREEARELLQNLKKVELIKLGKQIEMAYINPKFTKEVFVEWIVQYVIGRRLESEAIASINLH